jgi:hypothetical protein
MYYVAIILIIVILIIFYSEELRLHPRIDPEDTIPFSSYRHKIRTGDIIVVHNSGFISSLIRIYDQSPATHSGILIVEDDDIYVCEIDFHSYFSHDIHISNIDEFMTKQRSQYIGVIPMHTSIPLTRHKLAKIKCKFDLTLGFFSLPGRIYCTTLVHRVLSQYNILPWDGSCEHKTTPKTYHKDPSIVFLDYYS